jgi:hypothetical protein
LPRFFFRWLLLILLEQQGLVFRSWGCEAFEVIGGLQLTKLTQYILNLWNTCNLEELSVIFCT